MIHKDDHAEDVLQDDGVTTKKMTINERACLKSTVETGKAPLGGFWEPLGAIWAASGPDLGISWGPLGLEPQPKIPGRLLGIILASRGVHF